MLNIFITIKTKGQITGDLLRRSGLEHFDILTIQLIAVSYFHKQRKYALSLNRKYIKQKISGLAGLRVFSLGWGWVFN